MLNSTSLGADQIPFDSGMEAVSMRRVKFEGVTSEPDLDFVLPGLEAGAVGMTCGEGGVGKSYMLLQIGLAISTGMPIVGGLWPAQKRGKVVYISAEDSHAALTRRVYALRRELGISDGLAQLIDEHFEIVSAVGADLTLVGTSGEASSSFARAFARWCRGKRLVIIDPLAHFHLGDELSNRDAMRLMRFLQRVAAEAGCAIIVVHHISKAGTLNASSAGAARGASAFSNVCRWQLNLARVKSTDTGKRAGRKSADQLVTATLSKVSHVGVQPERLLLRTSSGVLTCIDDGLYRRTPVLSAGGDRDWV